ncbi:MAG: hypothetical protein WDO12_03750 [Pseudomonadota bacterium]
MILSPKRLWLILRGGVLALALLTVVARPMYSTYCETHQLGHTLAALAHENFRPDSGIERQLDAEHAHGAHGLLHSDDGGAYADIAAVAVVPVVQFDSILNPPVVELPLLVQRSTNPFRPPIA